jgi:hypothetical protein
VSADDSQPREVRFFVGPPIPIDEFLRQLREEEAQEQQRDSEHEQQPSAEEHG